jgi:hypothetical protein
MNAKSPKRTEPYLGVEMVDVVGRLGSREMPLSSRELPSSQVSFNSRSLPGNELFIRRLESFLLF